MSEGDAPCAICILSEQAERKSEVASARVITFRLATEQFASVSGMHTLKQDDPELHVHFLCRETDVLMALEHMNAAAWRNISRRQKNTCATNGDILTASVTGSISVFDRNTCEFGIK